MPLHIRDLMTDITKREVPSWIEKEITLQGGLNRFGRPNYRVIWGGNRTYLVGGTFKDVVKLKDEDSRERAVVVPNPELRTLLKYNPHRWHLEKWCGPEFYGTEEDWYIQTYDIEAHLHTMGPYPHEGDYEHVFYLAMCSHMLPTDTEWCMQCKVSSGEYIPLEENLHILKRQIWALEQTRLISKVDEKFALFQREVDRREANRQRINEVVRNAMRPQLAMQPTSWQPGMGAPCSMPEPKFNEDAVIPRPGLGMRQN